MSEMTIDHNLGDDFAAAIQMAQEAAARDNMTYAICTQHRLPPGPDWMVVIPLDSIRLNVLFTAHALAQADGRFYSIDIPGPH